MIRWMNHDNLDSEMKIFVVDGIMFEDHFQ